MTIRGLPDWSSPVTEAGGGVFFVHEDPQRIAALPVSLGLAQDGENRPAFSLEVFGYTRHDGSLDRFGLLSLRFVPDYALGERQAAVFAHNPRLKIVPAVPRSGFLHFEGAQGLALPDMLTAPRPLEWTGTGALAFAARLDAHATAFVSDSLIGGLVLVDAVAQIEVLGLANRVAATAHFDPETLSDEIENHLPEGLLTRQTLIDGLVHVGTDGPLGFEGVDDEAGHLTAVAALAERWLGRFATMIPAGTTNPNPSYQLDRGALAPGLMRWDLNMPVIVPHGLVVRSNPLETARDAIRQGSELVRNRPLAPFETGLHLVTLHPNLPPRRAGVLILGAQIRVPANPPVRPQSVNASVRFGEGQSGAEAYLRLAPDEPLAFEIQTFAFVVENGQARRLEGAWQRHEDVHLTVSPDAFPVDFLRLEAEPALLRLGNVSARCTGRNGDVPWSSSVQLTREFPSVAVAVPADLADGKIDIAAEAHIGAGVVPLPALPLEDIWLDLGRFPGVGPRQLEIECRFDDETTSVLIDCVPEDRAGDPGAVVTIHLTPERSRREWRWLSVNPFAAGYRCRWTKNDDAAPEAPWSEVRDPALPLVLAAGGRDQSPVPTPTLEAPA